MLEKEGEQEFPVYRLTEAEGSRPSITITPEGKGIISGDLYEAAEAFWKLVLACAPPGWTLEKAKDAS